MKNPLIKATVKSTGKQIEVYKLKNKPGYCDYADCATEYSKNELILNTELKK